MSDKIMITISSVIKSPVEKVWKTWSTPEDIMQWNSASPDWHTPSATNDLRKGGKFSSTMAARDGSMSFDFFGTYDEVKENELIAYTMGDGRTVKVTFRQNGNETEVTEVFEAEGTNPPEMQRAGWQSILDNFKKYTEAKS